MENIGKLIYQIRAPLSLPVESEIFLFSNQDLYSCWEFELMVFQIPDSYSP
jgi:hypothetical protein